MKFWKHTKFVGLKSLNGNIINGRKIRLREKKLADVRNDYQWQTDPELSELDAASILDVSFSAYLLDYSSNVHRKDRHRFPLAIETTEGRHIGNCTCYDINIGKAETQIGIMIGDKDYWDKGYGTDVIKTLTNHIFNTSSFNRLYLKTLDWNERAQKCFKKCGFTAYGTLKRDGYNFLLMELKREEWEKGRGNQR